MWKFRLEVKNYLIWTDESDYVSLDLSPGFCGIFGLPQEYKRIWLKKSDDSFVFRNTPNIRNVQPTPIAMVHCDIVKPCPVSNELAPLLQTVPLKFKENNGYFEPNQLLFRPVTSSAFSAIEFEITQPNGDPLPLHCDEEAVEAASQGMEFTLLFRKRKDNGHVQQQQQQRQPRQEEAITQPKTEDGDDCVQRQQREEITHTTVVSCVEQQPQQQPQQRHEEDDATMNKTEDDGHVQQEQQQRQQKATASKTVKHAVKRRRRPKIVKNKHGGKTIFSRFFLDDDDECEEDDDDCQDKK